MDMGFEFVKTWIVNFKLNMCCWFAPVRFGLLITGYINIVLAYISLIGIADDSFNPILVQVQQTILDDNATKPIPILAYATELAFSVVLLCAIYRNDIQLLRMYMLYSISAIITSVLVYSMVVAAIGAIITVALVLSILFQVYVLILVRSLIVKMRLANKNQELPTLVLSSPIQEFEPNKSPEEDVESPVQQEPEAGAKHHEAKLETVDESPKEDNTNEIK